MADEIVVDPPKSAWVPTSGSQLGALVGLGVSVLMATLAHFQIFFDAGYESGLAAFMMALITYLHPDGRK